MISASLFFLPNRKRNVGTGVASVDFPEAFGYAGGLEARPFRASSLQLPERDQVAISAEAEAGFALGRLLEIDLSPRAILLDLFDQTGPYAWDQQNTIGSHR